MYHISLTVHSFEVFNPFIYLLTPIKTEKHLSMTIFLDLISERENY